MELKNKAIVLNLDSNGLGVLRSLGREEIEVWGIDFRKDAVGYYSKFCRKKFNFSNPAKEPEKLLTELIELGKNLPYKAVLLPTADYYVIFLSKYENELKEYFSFNIPSKEILDSIVDKKKQYDWASKLGIPIAKSFLPKSLNDLEEIDIKYPVIIKGLNSSKWSEVFNQKGFKANNFDELRQHLKVVFDKNILPIIQEIVIGPNKNHYKVSAYYNKERKPLAIFSTQKQRQFPGEFGVGTYMVSKKMPELIDLAKRFFEGIGFTGVGSIEFKFDERDGKFKLIELNPRLWQQNIQATYAGINFPLINYLDCVGEKIESIETFKEEVVWLDAIQDFQSFLYNYKNKQIKFLEWIKSLIKTNCFAYFAWDDPLPGLKNSNYWLKYLKLPFKLINKKHK